ncbi:MAG: 5'-methylthioadenosine/adenosylhomocysteine nucleosidase [Lachnospiraceae bacterium]|nr:5'-methylthioadenosine/adenosylhomocysteine nucleosidase [Lachnospiraceae bacterium]
MIGIIGAMDEEVNKLKAAMSDVEIKSFSSLNFYSGTISGHSVVVVRAGIGKVNAAMCTQLLIDKYEVRAVINTGIAGSLNKDINIGDIVLSTDALEHDMDAVAFGYPLGQIPRMDTLSFTADEKLRKAAKQACDKVLPELSVFEGRVVSGDQFISDSNKKDWLVENFGGFCTEMEGASIAHVCYLNKVPFLIIRAISDKADNSAHMDYPAFEAMAIDNSIALMKELVTRI